MSTCQGLDLPGQASPNKQSESLGGKPGGAYSFEPASTGSQAVASLIIGFSIGTYQYYDAEVGGPLKGPLNDTFKKARSYFTKTSSPRKLRTVLVLSQISHLVSLQIKTSEGPANSPYSHHVATGSVEESAPICAAASSNRALFTPSRLSEHFFYLLVMCDEKQSTCRRCTQYDHRRLAAYAFGGCALDLLFFFCLLCSFLFVSFFLGGDTKHSKNKN